MRDIAQRDNRPERVALARVQWAVARHIPDHAVGANALTACGSGRSDAAEGQGRLAQRAFRSLVGLHRRPALYARAP